MADINGMRLYPEGAISAIASAIRSKNGSTATYKVSQMAPAILSLKTDGEAGIIKKIMSSNFTNLLVDNCSNVGSYAFYMVSSLASVNFPSCSTIYASAFQSCSNLSSAIFPRCTSIYTSAFTSCSRLNTISFPICSSLATYVFQNCSALTTASFPSCTYLGSGAFRSCYTLTTTSFPLVQTMLSSTFAYCSSLALLSFPALKSIQGNYNFRNCIRLVSLYLMSTSVVTLGNRSAFLSTPISTYSTVAGRYGSIYVPASLLTSYKSATNWASYSARIVGV